jgi:LysM repeat protein
VRPTTTAAPTTTTTVPPTTIPPTTTTLPPTTTTTAPPPQPYVVVAGDTLVGIADRFGVAAQQITLVNRLSDPRRLQVGQTILIPVTPAGSAPSSG